MKPVTLLILLFPIFVFGQNLVVNPSAEATVRGEGWTVLNSGPDACDNAPSNTWLNWTLQPDFSTNYPGARTGNYIFFAGCSRTIGANFEVYQDIDLSADSSIIDAGELSTIFSGFVQTPVPTQADAGRFVVDFKNEADVILGTSYASPFQSNALGSGNTWHLYMDTRTAPYGTRKVRIRIQSVIYVLPAINAYFDDISFTTAFILPLKLNDFKAQAEESINRLTWTLADRSTLKQFVIERSVSNQNWQTAGVVSAASISNNNFSFIDAEPGLRTRYRLVMQGSNGETKYSNVVEVTREGLEVISMFPNPATNEMNIKLGKNRQGEITIANLGGLTIAKQNLSGSETERLNISALRQGIYLLTIRYADGRTITRKFSKA